MKMMRGISGMTINDIITYECIGGNLEVALIGNKMRESQLIWFGLVK